MLEFLKRIVKLVFGKVYKSMSLNKVILMLIGCLVVIKQYFAMKNIIPEKSMSEFLGMLKKGELQSAKVTSESILALTNQNKVIQVAHSMMPKDTLFGLLSKAKINFFYEKPGLGNFQIFLIGLFISTVCTFIYINWTSKTNYKDSRPEKKIKFSDIIGVNQAKLSLLEVIEYMFSEEKYHNLGARMRKGILLYGPSGTGKTTLAKACANQANIPFYSCSAAQFCEIYVGMGPKKVRQLFAKAKQSAPSIIYIDEIDAIGKRSNGGLFESSNSEKNSTINQLLSEIDGFDSVHNVLVIASTNKLQMVDQSLIRPGRFDLKISIPLPSAKERSEIMKLHLQKKKSNLSPQFIVKISKRLEGWSGADIQNLTNEAVYRSLRRKSSMIEEEDIFNLLKINVEQMQEKDEKFQFVQ